MHRAMVMIVARLKVRMRMGRTMVRRFLWRVSTTSAMVGIYRRRRVAKMGPIDDLSMWMKGYP